MPRKKKVTKRRKKASSKRTSDKEPKLTAKQEKFINEYAISLNGADAARKAGYPEGSARQIAAENLSKHYIRKAVEIIRKKRNLSFKRDQDAILADILAIKEMCLTDKDSRAALKALELESRHGGHLTDKRELSNPDGSLKPRVVVHMPDNGRKRK